MTCYPLFEGVALQATNMICRGEYLNNILSHFLICPLLNVVWLSICIYQATPHIEYDESCSLGINRSTYYT